MAQLQKSTMSNTTWKQYAPHVLIGAAIASFTYLISILGTFMFTRLLPSGDSAVSNTSFIVISIVSQIVAVLLTVAIARSLYKAISDPRPLAMALLLASMIMALTMIMPFVRIGFVGHITWSLMQLVIGAAAGLATVSLASRIKNTKILYVVPLVLIVVAYTISYIALSAMFKDF